MLKRFAHICIFLGVALTAWYLWYGDYFSSDYIHPNNDKIKVIQSFVTGIAVPLVTLGSSLLVLVNLRLTAEQNFSSNFFKLLDQHHKLVENIETAVDQISDEAKPSCARAFFDDLAFRIAHDYKCILDNALARRFTIDADLEVKAEGKNGRDLLIVIYDYYFQIHQSDLGHYFRNLYHIVRFVDKSKFSEEIKMNHVKILRAQLSNYEILLLAYNALQPYGNRFHPLVEKYHLLKNLNSEESLPAGSEQRIIDFTVLEDAYPQNFKAKK